MWRKALDTPLNTPEKCPMSVSTVIGRHLYKEKKSWQWFHDFFSAAAENAHLWGQEWKPDLPWLLGNPQNTDRILSRYWKFSGFARGDSAPVHLPDLP
jgi:hypothetical protein